jgi:regulator of CtrA degradation
MNTPLKAFLDGAYDDAYGLLVDLRDYISDQSWKSDPALDQAGQVKVAHEVTRLTRLVTEMMAWLMLQKAVDAGEMTHAEAADHPAGKLGDPEDDAEAEEHTRLPIEVRGMIARGRRLQTDVLQLETRVRRLAG